MIRISPLIAFVLLMGPCAAQSWCPPGAEWISKPPSGWPVLGYDRVFYAGDTSVGGINGQRLSRQHAERPWSDPTIFYFMQSTAMITAYENGVALLWSDQLSEWDTLFWFAADPGDRWHRAHDIPIPGNPSDWIEVVDTATIIVDGMALRQLQVEQVCDDQWVNWGGTVTERLGYWTPFYFPMACSTESGIWELECYNDVQIHYQRFIDPCDVFLSLEERSEVRMPVSPNPGTDHFILSLPADAHMITVLDAVGRTISTQRAYGTTTIDASAFPPGIYRIQVEATDGAVRSASWVKQ